MTPQLLLVTGLLFAVPAHATLVALSGTASVNVQGNLTIDERYGTGIPPQSYNDTQATSTPFGSFHGAVANSATVTLSEPISGLQPPYPTGWSVSSQASQTTSITGNGISLAGNLSASIGANPQIGGLNAAAQSGFDLIFRLDEAMTYTLAVDVTALHGHGFDSLVSPPTFSLTALGGGPSIDAVPRTGTWTWGYSGSGLLMPGDYRLIYNLGALAFNDPLGDFDTKSFSLALNVASVPETGTTLALSALSLALLAALRRTQLPG